MRIPFPSDLLIGTDIVYLPRLFKSPAQFEKLARRILLPDEHEHFNLKFPDRAEDKVAKGSRVTRAQEWLGGRWAAKEAAKKAWGAPLVGFQDLRVRVKNNGGGLQIWCTPFPTGFSHHDEQAAQLTISHDGEYAVATVLAAPLHESVIAELGRRKAEAEKKVNVQAAVTHLSNEKTKASPGEKESSGLNTAVEP